MRRAIPPLPNTLSWRSAQLRKKYRDNFNFTFILNSGEPNVVTYA
jgi:hypothetical protein